jgi:hypothetical protein
MSDEILGAAIEAIVGAVVGFTIAWLTIKSQQKRQVVQVSCTSSPLLELGEVSKALLQVSVDKSLLTGNQDDKGTRSVIGDAYGHMIQLRNPRKDTVDAATVLIHFDDTARVLDYHFQPNPRDYFDVRGHVDPERLNQLIVTLPYLNGEQHVQVKVLTTADSSLGIRDVTSGTKGVYVEKEGILQYLGFTRSSILVTITLVFLLFIVSSLEVLGRILPPSVLVALGASAKPTKEWVWPFWYSATAMTIGLVLIAHFAHKAYRLAYRPPVV